MSTNLLLVYEQLMLTDFDPNSTLSSDSGIFGLPFTEDTAKLVLIPVPWEATTSYGGGTSGGPKGIRAASPQLDLFDQKYGNFWRSGIFMLKESADLRKENKEAKSLVQQVIAKLEKGQIPENKVIEKINRLTENMLRYVEHESYRLRQINRTVGVVGGDHSVPLGLIRVLDSEKTKFGVLHIDAHADLRSSYQGFKNSHASIMFNVLEQAENLTSLVGVGYRDVSEGETQLIRQEPRIKAFFDWQIKEQQYANKSWQDLCREILKPLPRHVYVSFDIDGLSPEFCPSTGTPVPGGLGYSEALYLLDALVDTGRTIIGFDLCEVAPGKTEWDCNVGARILYRLCAAALSSQTLHAPPEGELNNLG